MGIMIDIETLGQEPGCVISQIAAVQFDSVGGTLGRCTAINVSIASCSTMGLKFNPETIKWWFTQSKEAQEHFNSNDSVHINSALCTLSDFIKSCNDYEVWGFGSTFDIVLLESAYRHLRLHIPWSYRQSNCLRTLYKIYRNDVPKPAVKTKEDYLEKGLILPLDYNWTICEHDALTDAVVQAEWCINLLQRAQK